jgi:hypothetical protein
MYSIREKCIFCNNILNKTYFEKDYEIPISCYSKDNSSDDIFIPYNIFKCNKCYTSQTKYLGDLNEIYKINHADSTGKIMQNLHITVLNLIKKYISDINNFVEIGSSKGVLCDLILNNTNINKYYIIEPSYFGTKNEKKIILNDYFENINFKEYSDANTLIISHVYEHFYNPLEILNKIYENKNIENFILVWPDLEYYKDNKNYHVLNTEHTFYVDNNFIITLLNNYSFKLIEKINYENHSVIFYFNRNENLKNNKLININHDITSYYNNLFQYKEKIEMFIKTNKKLNKKICIWPCSVHTQFLLIFLKNLDIDYVLDNSTNKINKYLYGYNLKCLNFLNEIKNNNNGIILNGGVFNKEIKDLIEIDENSILFLK